MSVIVTTERWVKSDTIQEETEYTDADGFGTGPGGELLILKESRLEKKSKPIAIYAKSEWISAELT
jgi:hypothetical protein